VNWLGHHDLGVIAPGGEARHELVLKNPTDAPLAIKAVTASYECLQITAAPQVVPRGAAGRPIFLAKPCQPVRTRMPAFLSSQSHSSLFS
jgi:hypothetical protein